MSEPRQQRKLKPPSGPPHSWELKTWPESVWPHESKRAQWICRAYRKELIRAGAITRIGTTLVVLSRGYTSWLERNVEHVEDYRSNNPTLGRPR
jgi:hypothetical protein